MDSLRLATPPTVPSKAEAALRARMAIKVLDAGFVASEPIHGLTQKQYDRYLHYRLTCTRTVARRLALTDGNA